MSRTMNASHPSIVIIVSGSRHWTNKKAMDMAFRIVFAEFIAPRIDTLGEIVLLHGGARGADTMSESAFRDAYDALMASSPPPQSRRRIRTRIERSPPDWDRYLKAAGPIRNAEMFAARLLYADHIILHFHDALHAGESKGTKHMYDLCMQAVRGTPPTGKKTKTTKKKKSSGPVRFCHFESRDTADQMTQKVVAAGMAHLPSPVPPNDDNDDVHAV
jgi:hypothetical protein